MALSTSKSSFTAIGEGIHLFSPENSALVDLSHPTLILIFGWMGAKLPHLYKYTSVYQEQYPNTKIILVRSEPLFYLSSEKSRQKALEPVVNVLEAVGYIPPPQQHRTLRSSTPSPRHRILIHTFSNGGCSLLTTLGQLLSTRRSNSEPSATTAISAIVLDSCPGNGSFTAGQRAFASVIRHPVARILVRIMIALFFCVNFIATRIFRKTDYIKVMRSSLNNPSVLPWVSKSTPRLYIYSEGDEIVEADAVEEHMNDAMQKGLVVSVEKFGKESKHVSHARTNPQRYWAAVRRLWEEALGLGSRN